MTPETLEIQTVTIATLAKSLRVKDQRTMDLAGRLLTDQIKPLIKEANEVFDPVIYSAHASHKVALAAKAKVTKPLLEAEHLLKAAVGAYIIEEQRRRTAEAERLLREQEEQIEAEIVAAEAEGEVYVETFMPLPVVTPPPMPSGISTQERWYAEVVSIRELAAAVGAGQQPEELLIGLDRYDTGLSSPALNKMATALRSALSIPGVRPYMKLGVAARAK